MSSQLAVTAALLCAVAAHGASGIYMREQTRHFGRAEGASTSSIYLEAQRVRVDSAGTDQKQQVFIYHGGDAQRLYLIDVAAGTYRTFTKAELERMMGSVNTQMDAIRAKMDAQLKNMDPKQRDMVEKMMKGRMGTAEPAAVTKTTYQLVESDVTVGEWECDKYDGLKDGEKVREIYTTDWSTFGLKPADFAVFRELASMFAGMAKQAQVDIYQVGSENALSDEEFEGVPVRRISYRDGQPSQQHDVIEVSRKDFEDEIFQLFEGLKKLENPQVPQMGGLDSAQPRR
jgi:hypothetical protein